jgi:uncharacterized membrane protein
MGTTGESRVTRPFWLHQIVEYILGVVLISQGLQLREPLTLTAAGIVILVNAAVVTGPISAFQFFSRRAHQFCDLVVAVALVALGVQPLWAMDPTSRSILIATGVVMVMLWRFTDYRPPTPRTRSRGTARPPRSRDPERYGRAAGRAAGGVVMRWRQQRRTDPEP